MVSSKSIFKKNENTMPMRRTENTKRIQYTTTIPSFVIEDVTKPVAECNFFKTASTPKFSNKFWLNRTIKPPFSSRCDLTYIL